MKILILDIYPNKPYRISKDNNGGYGSANKYGTNLISKAINWFVKKNVDWPPLSCVHVAGILREKNHQVEYMKTLPENLDNQVLEYLNNYKFRPLKQHCVEFSNGKLSKIITEIIGT